MSAPRQVVSMVATHRRRSSCSCWDSAGVEEIIFYPLPGPVPGMDSPGIPPDILDSLDQVRGNGS